MLASSWKDRYDEETQAKIQQSLLKACNNLTVTLIKLNQWEKAMDPCSTAERIDRNNVKTLFQKGKASRVFWKRCIMHSCSMAGSELVRLSFGGNVFVF